MEKTIISWSSFLDSLQKEVAVAEQENVVVALIVIQVRQLPIYNFRLGFSGGEDIMYELNRRLHEILKHAIDIQRIAPDKLGIIIPDLAVPKLLSISAQKIVDELAQPFLVGNEIVSVMTSVGISIFPEHGTTAEALLSEAELSIYSSVKSAKSFHIPKQARSHQHLMMMQMGSDLQTAIADESLVLHYQPKVDLKEMKPVASEALMRWVLPDGTRVRPDEFIPVAEASGTIFNLTEWALNTALREGSEINGRKNSYSVAVNVSAGTIYDPSLVYILETALAIWDLPPELLTIEVTESTLMKNPDVCFRHLNMLRNMGVKIAIDDFGTGFSSLAYFKDIPADEIKIDQSFVKDMFNSIDDQKIVSLVIDLSHRFDLEVVAEGIEDENTLHMLQDMGCDIGQGYFLGMPMTFDDFHKWLSQHK